MPTARPGDRVLAPVRGHVIHTTRDGFVGILPDEPFIKPDGTPVVEEWHNSRIIPATRTRITTCDDCGFPMYRGGHCWTCDVLREAS